MRPLIGITLDWQENGSFSKRPHYALREHYFNAVYAAGGLPVAIPLITAAQEDYLARVQGVVVPGGDYPSPGWWYGKADDHLPHPRPDADVAFIRLCLAHNKPLLGICAGMQTLAVATGGQLHWNIKQALNAHGHRETPLEQMAHAITIQPDSLLARTVGTTELHVNSHHNEGVASVGAEARVVATAPDGVIEAIEIPTARFALGVEWHPEMFTAEGHPDRKIFEGFIAAANGTLTPR